ncbi:MAG: CO dehydrogenase/acetyl-CoA synthase complex subunit epsilon [Candidatus Helarchaeota archaeon]|nr:CO dehydrogenase/acetyl-CoA synthase complex subunit epsilon [Candidatus Helarchaeota archaeon]
MYKVKPWQPNAVVGPTAGTPMAKPIALGKMIAKAKRPIFVVGVEGLLNDVGGKQIIDLIIEVGKKGIPIVATAHSSKYFLERGFKPSWITNSNNITNRLADPDWEGIDGKGNYDFAVYCCIIYNLQVTLLNCLKNYAFKHLKTISLDRFYFPTATYSLANLKKDKYKTAINEIINEIIT